MKKSERILQIIPADGWHAKYKEDDGAIMLCKVMCFALVAVTENGDVHEDVRAIDGDDEGLIEFANTLSSNFAGLVHESDPKFNELMAGLRRAVM